MSRKKNKTSRRAASKRDKALAATAQLVGPNDTGTPSAQAQHKTSTDSDSSVAGNAPMLASLVLDASLATWADRVKANGGTVQPAQLLSMDELVRSLKGCGIWERLDGLWLFAAANQGHALVDIVHLREATAVGEPLFLIGRGYVFDGSQHIDTGFKATNPQSRYSLQDAGFGGYVFGAATRNGGVEFGNDYGAYTMISVRFGMEIRRFQVNSRTDSASRIESGGKHTGHFHGQRTNQRHSALYVDGICEGVSTEEAAVLSNKTFYVGAGRAAAGPYAPSTSSISTAHVGASLTEVQIDAFNHCISRFLSKVGLRPDHPDSAKDKSGRRP